MPGRVSRGDNENGCVHPPGDCLRGALLPLRQWQDDCVEVYGLDRAHPPVLHLSL
jgi:hypothetical protein